MFVIGVIYVENDNLPWQGIYWSKTSKIVLKITSQLNKIKVLWGISLFENGLFSKIKNLEMPLKHFRMLCIILSF